MQKIYYKMINILKKTLIRLNIEGNKFADCEVITIGENKYIL